MKKIAIGISVVIITLFCFWFFYLRTARENRLIKEGNQIVGKIEAYKRSHNKLPVSLEEIGTQVIDEANPPLYYERWDSTHYIVWFGTSLGESKTYYSDSKKWEDYAR